MIPKDTLRLPTWTTKDEKHYRKELEKFVDTIYEAADDKGWAWPQLAHQARLAYTTVMRLGNYTTRSPHFLTIFKLAEAVGLEFELVRLRRRYGRTG